MPISRSLLRPFVAGVSLVLLLPMTELPAHAEPAPPDTVTVSRLAKSYTDLLNGAITFGRVSVGNRPATTKGSDFQGKTTAKQKELTARRAWLKARGEYYSKYETFVQVGDIRRAGDSFLAESTEITRLYYGGRVPGAPEFTEFSTLRDFELINGANGWELSGARPRLQDAGLLPVNETGAPAPAVATSKLAPLKAGTKASTNRNDASARIKRKDGRRSNAGGGATIQATASLNYQAMIDYALRYWSSYNPSYRSWAGSGGGGDCTNFVSQAMRAGGWGDRPGYYLDYRYWWYNWANQTRSWINAHYWYWFSISSGRTYTMSNAWNLLASDVLQADWDRNGVPDHTMIVTARDSAGVPYLTYHSINTRNRTLTAILAANPNAWYYAHRT